MCGLLFTNDPNISVKNFTNAFKLLLHRGPDYSEIINIGGIKAGHHRLSILDLNSRSNQPYKIGNYILLFNGEIYNYKKLIIDHYLKTQTKSDTEVILLLYIKYGPSFLKFLNGMFSIVIFNTKNFELFVARDRLGVKPLYIWRNEKSVILSSEISPILYLKKCELNFFAIRQYKKLRMTIKGDTYYKNIKMFPSGCYLKKNQIYKYWELQIQEKPEPSYEKLKFLIEDSINIRKVSDVPFGTFLSGGLDSSIISIVAKPDRTWTVGLKKFNEFYWSDLVNKKLQSKNYKLRATNSEFVNTLDFMVKKRKEPLCVPNEVLLYQLSKKIKKYNTVVLSGEGADELFWGYDRIFRWANKKKKINYQEFESLYCYGHQKDDEVVDFALNNLPGKRVEDKISYFMQIYHLHGLLRRLDNSTMLASVEARVPFVDYRLIELVSGTSFKWKFKYGVKSPLKKIFNQIVPKQIINRKKMGFPIDLKSIFKCKNINPYTFWFNYNLKLLNIEE